MYVDKGRGQYCFLGLRRREKNGFVIPCKMIADSRFKVTSDLKENNGWPICLIHRNPQAPFCPIMSKLVLEL